LVIGDRRRGFPLKGVSLVLGTPAADRSQVASTGFAHGFPPTVFFSDLSWQVVEKAFLYLGSLSGSGVIYKKLQKIPHRTLKQRRRP
jgi:hypothetical protein